MSRRASATTWGYAAAAAKPASDVDKLGRQCWHRRGSGSHGSHSVRIYDDPDQIH